MNSASLISKYRKLFVSVTHCLQVDITSFIID